MQHAIAATVAYEVWLQSRLEPPWNRLEPPWCRGGRLSAGRNPRRKLGSSTAMPIASRAGGLPAVGRIENLRARAQAAQAQPTADTDNTVIVALNSQIAPTRKAAPPGSPSTTDHTRTSRRHPAVAFGELAAEPATEVRLPDEQDLTSVAWPANGAGACWADRPPGGRVHFPWALASSPPADQAGRQHQEPSAGGRRAGWHRPRGSRVGIRSGSC